MHDSSYVKAEVFVREYLGNAGNDGKPLKVLEVGSKSYHTQDTYRGLFPAPRFSYTGLDIEAGENVDIVPANPFVWDEIAESSFDACVSGQTFEHNPYFWITFAEIARVLVPGGVALIVAPGGGPVHRYPVDCWRFYPDSWAALCTLTGLELAESYFEPDHMSYHVSGGNWRDSAAIVRKPMLDGAAAAAFHDRLGAIVALFRQERMPVQQAPLVPGKWVRAYEDEMLRRSRPSVGKRLRKKLAGRLARIHS